MNIRGNINYIKAILELYTCNHVKNDKCKKTCCKYIDGIEGCIYTTEWKYAKKTPLNYIKRMINKIIRR